MTRRADAGTLGDALGWFCPKCLSYHEPPECGFDPARPCRYCTRPVVGLTTGGPEVCAACEVHGVPPAIYMGRQKPYDFHAERIAAAAALLRDLGPLKASEKGEG